MEMDAVREEFGAWAASYVRPLARTIDANGVMPRDFLRTLGNAGLIGSMLAPSRGGSGRSHRDYVAISEELGRCCSNVRNLVAVQDMVAHAISEWGTSDQCNTWLPRLTSGEACAAFALTEPGTGSDAASVKAHATMIDGEVVISGEKTWISFGQIADLLLVFVQLDGQHAALLIERDTEGLSIEPAATPLGLSGSMLSRIVLERVRVPRDAIVGIPGTGLTFVASRSLAIGRLSTAAGSVGLAQACLEATIKRTQTRTQFGVPIGRHQIVQGMLADMAVGTRAARLLCEDAAAAFDRQDVDADYYALMAKYHASVTAMKAAQDAVQLHGADGLDTGSEVGRFFRDAKALEIIEGTTQVIRALLGSWSNLASCSRP